MDSVYDDEELLLVFGFLLSVYCYVQLKSCRRWWVRPIYAQRKKKGAFVNIFCHMKMLDHEMFHKYTRMLPDQFQQLLNMVKHKLQKRSRREYVSPEQRLALTVKYLAHGGTFQNIAWEFRVGHSTVSKIIVETCEAMWEVLQPLYVKMPSSDEEWLSISDAFWNRWNFPHTVGAIDGKHVCLQCPINSGSLYYNYKHYYSLVLLACCDANYKFIWVDLGAEGSLNDAGIFRSSQIGHSLNTGQIQLPSAATLPHSNTPLRYFFVGDEAFPLTHYLMRPYPGKHLNQLKRIFNYRLSRARRVIENTFGILASRWCVYRAPLLCSLPTCKAIVKATICLHNFLRCGDENTYMSSNLTDRELDDGTIIAGEWRDIVKHDSNLTRVGRMGSNTAPRLVYSMRDTLAEYLTSVGAVPWQLHYVTRGRIV